MCLFYSILNPTKTTVKREMVKGNPRKQLYIRPSEQPDEITVGTQRAPGGVFF
jgi:hypothetical protein